jgi:hypothetical protein
MKRLTLFLGQDIECLPDRNPDIENAREIQPVSRISLKK